VSEVVKYSPLVIVGEVSDGVDNRVDIIKVHLSHHAVDDESHPLGGTRPVRAAEMVVDSATLIVIGDGDYAAAFCRRSRFQFQGRRLIPKRLGLLRDLLPQVKTIAALLNPTSQSSAIQSKDLLAAGPASGFEIDILNAGSEAEIKTAFATLAQRRVGALIVASLSAAMPPWQS
jgi:hypothetical protein